MKKIIDISKTLPKVSPNMVGKALGANSIMQKERSLFSEDNNQYKLEAEYGLTIFKGQSPYFSITANLYEYRIATWKDVSGGCLHEDIKKYLPDLKSLIKWHLFSIDTGPMHYIANAMFWWERSLEDNYTPVYTGDTCAIGDKAQEHFKSTIVFGAIPEDEAFQDAFNNRKSVETFRIKIWLQDRLPLLIEAFNKDMETFNVIL